MNTLSSVLVLLAIVVCASATCNLNTFAGGKFERCQSVNQYYDVYWKIVGDEIVLGVRLENQQGDTNYQNGWMGLGWSVNGGMRGADITVIRRVAGTYVAEDRFVSGLEAEPDYDDHQDVTLINATSTATETIAIFVRKLKSCDLAQDVAIGDNKTQVIFAWGTSFGYHGTNNRGTDTLYFHSQAPNVTLPVDAVSIDLLTQAYEIPAQETTYVCTPLQVPADKKYHIVRWRPKIQAGNEPYVHHMVLFGCPTVWPVNHTYECGMAPQSCYIVAVAWSLGQAGTDYHLDYAVPFGKGAGLFSHLYLQMHYNNPGQVAGVVDSSGIEISYTPTLRKYDVGFLITSTNMKAILIPPMTPKYSQNAECPGQCTQRLNQTVNLINVFPHMHEVGQKIWVQHIRGTQELPEIFRDDHYDFQRQQNYDLDVKLVPGDRVKVQCQWNTVMIPRHTNTTGGEASSQEMCISLIQFYPYYPEWAWINFCSDGGYAGQASCDKISNKTIYNTYPTYTALPVIKSNFTKTTCPLSTADVFLGKPSVAPSVAPNTNTNATESPVTNINGAVSVVVSAVVLLLSVLSVLLF